MILVDSSVWIDFFRNIPTWQVTALDRLIEEGDVVTGDLILLEVLQGFRTDAHARRAEKLFAALETIAIGGRDTALLAARNYRELRGRGITVRSSIDTLIATRCLKDGLTLLHSDRDYEPFERELGLSVVRQAPH